MSGANGNGRHGGAPRGNTNAFGNRRQSALKDEERAARRRADELLNLATAEAVEVLLAIMRDEDSTNFDKRACAEALLDRKIPKMTQERVMLQDARKTLLEIPLAWPPPLEVVAGGDA
jgi:hypothetical protein